jgi:hypothetical protein
MHDSFDIARRDINRDALLEAIGGCLRVEHGPVEETLPGRLAALLDQLTESRNGIWALRVSSDEPLSADQGRNSVPVTSDDKKGTLPLHGGASGSGGPPGERNGQYRHSERTKPAIAERQKFSTLLKMLRAGLT